jgi:hypothetical protein
MNWDLLLNFIIGLTYGHYGCRFYVTARRRVEHRSGHELNRVLALLWALLWPVWLVMWIMTAIVFQKAPASLLREPSKADRAAVEMDRRKEERSAAIQDWQARASYWHKLGQQAEAEDDQALKWAVAENLNFLLETKPEGAQVKGLTKPEKVSVDPETVDSDKPIEEWSSYSERQRALKARMKVPKNLYVKPVRLDESSPAAQPASFRAAHVGGNAVGFCNVCYCYRKPGQMAAKGMCNECAIEQGF